MKKLLIFALFVNAALLAGRFCQELPVTAQQGSGGGGQCSLENPRLWSIDVNKDGSLDISDPVFILNYLFSGGDKPRLCLAEETTFCNVCDDLFVGEGQEESVTSEMICPACVTTQKLADASVDTQKLANASVSTEKLANGSVSSEKLAAASVDSEKLAAASVSTEKLVNGSVNAEKLADASVDTEKLADASVNEFKLADGVRQTLETTVQTLAATVTTQPLTIYVSTAGDDANDGTEEAPKLTLRNALNSIPAIVRHNVTIRVEDGTYIDDPGFEYTHFERQFVNNSRIAIIGNEADKTAVHWTSTVPARNYFFKNCRLFIHHIKISEIRLSFMDGTEAAMESMDFQWDEANEIVVHPFAQVSLSGDITIRSTADSYEGLITVDPHGFLSFSGVEASDELGKKGVLIVVFGGGHLNLTSNVLIDNFDVGIALGTYGAAPNGVPPMATAVIDNPTNGETKIQNCNIALKICGHSHAVYRWRKVTYTDNVDDEFSCTGSTYEQGE